MDKCTSIALSPNISSLDLEDETKSPLILICNQMENQIFYMLWQYKLDKDFDLTFTENRSLLSPMTAKIFLKMSVNGVFQINWRLTNFEVGFI